VLIPTLVLPLKTLNPILKALKSLEPKATSDITRTLLDVAEGVIDTDNPVISKNPSAVDEKASDLKVETTCPILPPPLINE